MTCRSSRAVVLVERIAERFWTKVRKGDGDACWEWTAGRMSKRPQFAYGAFWTGTHMDRAHRVAWVLAGGQIPDGLCVLHRCDNVACVRPDHLFLGTQEENVADRHAKGRTADAAGALSLHTGMPRRWASGERTGKNRLTWPRVRGIRRLRALTGATLADMSVRYGVSVATVGRVIQGRIWKEAA